MTFAQLQACGGVAPPSLVGYGADGTATAPIDEPLTLAEAKRQIRREDVTTDDTLIAQTLIPAVRERGEQASGRQFITARYRQPLDRFPCDAIVLPLPPLQSVVSITYLDPFGVEQTLATDQYVVLTSDGPRGGRGRIIPAYNVVWPYTQCRAQAVTVTFVAGYGDDRDAVPPRLKMAMLLGLGTLYENREDQVMGQGIAVVALSTAAGMVYDSFRRRA